MKDLIKVSMSLTFIFLISGCTSEKSYLKKIKEQNKELSDALNQCQSSLSLYRSGSDSTESSTNSTTESTPACQIVKYDEIYVNDKLVDMCLSDEVTLTECGVKAKECNSKSEHYCLQNVKIKTIEKEECSKE